jgi:pyruvate,water dikinase
MSPENKTDDKKKAPYVLSFGEIDGAKFALAGGKGANLGELSGVGGIQVPDGFCVTTEAYRKITANNPGLAGLLDELARIKAEERESITAITAKIRGVIESVLIPMEIADELSDHLVTFGEHDAFAVRSSSTAEGFADGILCWPAGHLFEHYWERSHSETRQQMLGIAVYGQGSDLPHSKWI